MRVTNSTHATAHLQLRAARLIATLPSSTATQNVVRIPTSGLRRCHNMVGDPQQPLVVRLRNAPPGSSLRVDCPTAQRLTLDSQKGTCLQAVLTNAKQILMRGNGSIVVYPSSLPNEVDVSGMTRGGTVVLRLSEGRRDIARVRGVVVRGLQSATTVTVYGCGARTVRCKGCRVVERCVATRELALAALARAVDAECANTVP